MSNGALILASNSLTRDNAVVDYVGLAKINAKLIRKHLGLPVALITSDDVDPCDFEEVIKIDEYDSSLRNMLSGSDVISYWWKNDGRIDAYDLSPWNKTLLIDADYIVRSDRLLPLLDTDYGFMIADSVYDVTGRDSWRSAKFLPNLTIKQRWATVMLFDKTAEYVFDAAKMVRSNYDYYAASFGFGNKPIRNDYIFSIVAQLLNLDGLPFAIPMSPADVVIRSSDNDGMRLEYGSNLLRWSGDLHIINKSLMNDIEVLAGLL